MAAAGADLYRAQTVVTGEGEANRIIGFASCLEDVLIKPRGSPVTADWHRRGMRMVLPDAQALAKPNLNGVKLMTVPSSTLVAVAAEQGGEAALIGQLVWDDRRLGWDTRW